jgi:CRP-like cAMP-binding protein
MPRPKPRPDPSANHLLAALPPGEYRRLARRLVAVPLAHGQALFEVDQPIRHAYFLETGLVSLLAPMEDGAQVEVGMVGREGLVGVPLLLGTDTNPFRAVVQIPGAARRLEAEELRAAVKRCPALAELLPRYLGAFLVHLTRSAACNGHHSVEKRCCRWLLTAHDRTCSDEMPLTQEYMAAMLSVRRAGVGQVTSALQRAGLIRYRRGRLTILDRAGLEARACECYRIAAAAFQPLRV